MRGHDLIRAERIRQEQSEHYTAEKDVGRVFELAVAAARYAENGAANHEYGMTDYIDPPEDWPWANAYWKPQDPKRDLIRAGALIAAAIDALQEEEKINE